MKIKIEWEFSLFKNNNTWGEQGKNKDWGKSTIFTLYILK